MRKGALEQAVELAQKVKNILVATADGEGLPHIAAAGKLGLNAGNRVEVAAWFCPSTVANLEENHRISLVIWDSKDDVGYQLLGRTEKVEEVAMMNGYVPGEEGNPPLPQVERKLRVRVERILHFGHRPHSDQEEK